MSVANPDRLSFERTRAAYDRTVMTWIRTAASLITFGFSAYKFFQFAPGGGQRHPLLGPREFSLLDGGRALLALVLGSVDHCHSLRVIRAECPELNCSRAGVLGVCPSIQR